MWSCCLSVKGFPSHPNPSARTVHLRTPCSQPDTASYAHGQNTIAICKPAPYLYSDMCVLSLTLRPLSLVMSLSVPQLHWATLVREYVRVRVWQSTGTRRSNKTATRLRYGGPTSLAAGFVSGPRQWLHAQRRRLGLCVHTRPEFDDDGRFNF